MLAHLDDVQPEPSQSTAIKGKDMPKKSIMLWNHQLLKKSSKKKLLPADTKISLNELVHELNQNIKKEQSKQL
jgi:hypothetical protein